MAWHCITYSRNCFIFEKIWTSSFLKSWLYKNWAYLYIYTYCNRYALVGCACKRSLSDKSCVYICLWVCSALQTTVLILLTWTSTGTYSGNPKVRRSFSVLTQGWESLDSGSSSWYKVVGSIEALICSASGARSSPGGLRARCCARWAGKLQEHEVIRTRREDAFLSLKPPLLTRSNTCCLQGCLVDLRRRMHFYDIGKIWESQTGTD